MSKPTANMKCVLVIASHSYLRAIIEPALDIERNSIQWDYFDYKTQSGGVQTALSLGPIAFFAMNFHRKSGATETLLKIFLPLIETSKF